MAKRIVIVGSVNMDMVVSSPKVPVLGETILGSDFMMVPGGKGANQSVAAARLGADVTFIGCVGNDLFGQDLREHLSANHVNVEHVAEAEGIPTGVAVITVKDGDNFIIVAPGANSELSPIRMEELEETIADASILIIQLEIPFDTVRKAVEIANKHRVKVLLNPAPARELDDPFLSAIDILTPNEHECELITGISVKGVEDAKKVVAHLNQKGVKQVVVTLGSKGAVYNSGGEILHQPAPSVSAIDTTAAGDSFTAAVAYALMDGKSIDAAVEFGCAVGALTVTKKGAQSSLPHRQEVTAFMNRSRSD
jgi:ribokinase